MFASDRNPSWISLRKMEFIGFCIWEGQDRSQTHQVPETPMARFSVISPSLFSASLFCVLPHSLRLFHVVETWKPTALGSHPYNLISKEKRKLVLYLWFRLWQGRSCTSGLGHMPTPLELPLCLAHFDIMINPSWVRYTAMCVEGEWGKVLSLPVPPGLYRKDSEGGRAL